MDATANAMMLTTKERVRIAVLVDQARYDGAYMGQWINDPESGFTRGIIDRHMEMARWVSLLLEHVELAIAVDVGVVRNERDD